MKKNWPLVLALLYIINPFDLPGLIDDAIVTLLMAGLRAWLGVKEKKGKKS